MKVSPSTRSETREIEPGLIFSEARKRQTRFAVAVAALYLLAHLPYLAPSLEDIDSINFALGLREFDVAKHQPHPPGSPVYIALGRVSRALVELVAPPLPGVRVDALALAIWSALAGAIALVAAARLFRLIGGDAGDAKTVPWAVLLLAASPLFWISGLRPMSDLPGLAAALVAQVRLVAGLSAQGRGENAGAGRSASWDRQRTVPRGPHRDLGRADRGWRGWLHGDIKGRSLLADPVVAGALVAGLAAGIRIQTVWLTMPLVVAAVIRRVRAGSAWAVWGPVAALAAGVAAWAVPLVFASGGPFAYLRALSTQAGEDFAWVDMLWANPTPRRVALSLYETFVMPWSVVPLAVVVGIAAVAGAIQLGVSRPRALAVVALVFAPYAVFHLLLQETRTVRYALPLLPPAVWLAVHGIGSLGRVAPGAAAVVIASTAVVSVPAGTAYGREPHPAFRAIADMEARAASAPPHAIYSHYALRRPLQIAAPAGITIVEPRRTYEWLGLVDYWRSGGSRPVWFFADPRRTDLALIDPHSRRPVAYRWTLASRLELNGTRPMGVDWYTFDRPGWFVGEGWSLTPETGGVVRATGTGPDRRPIEAYVLRRPGPMHAVVGVRHLGSAGDPATVFELTIDGRPVSTWTLDPRSGRNALQFIDLPSGLPAGESPYARLRIAARSIESGRPTPHVAVRQFDIQPAETLIYGFGEGWHEEEYDNVTGRRWRWTSDRSVLRIAPPRAARLAVTGESPLRYYDEPPRVRVTAGERLLAAFAPDDDFQWTIAIPADAVAASGGTVAIETDRVYLPAQAEGTPDERRLGLRLFDIRLYPVDP